jgi:signal transduction histidine kinase/ActR/RegA family two-component response regulator
MVQGESARAAQAGPTPPAPHPTGLVLLFSPFGRDAAMMASVLGQAGVRSLVCPDIQTLCGRLLEADTAVLAEETLDSSTVAALTRTLANQGRWSDFPLVVLGVPDSSSGDAVFERLSPVANLTLLERPTRPFTLVTVIRAALRSRARQYLTREHLEELLSARTEAERVGRMKDEFLATLSHELRTPLNAIAGWVHLLQRGVLTGEEQAKAIDTIARNTRAQRELIEELLDMSRIISGKVRLDSQPVDLVALLNSGVDSVRPAAEAKQVTLECRIESGDDGEQPLRFISGDPTRLQQVVWNLLNNAIKFTPPGGTVRAQLTRRGSEAHVTVTDTGAGIAPEFLPYVFDQFRQADSTTRRSHGGLGLGLSIVKQLVEMHGGTVDVVSAGEGKGSSFTFALPIAGRPAVRESEQPARPAVKKPALGRYALPVLRGVRVLVVDDDRDGRDLLQRFLEDSKASVCAAGSAAEARRVLESSEIDVLLSDIGMPGEDGYDLIRWVRGSQRPRVRGVPAGAITAFARSEDRAKALSCGYDAHLSKPVEPIELVALVDELRHTRGMEGGGAPAHLR